MIKTKPKRQRRPGLGIRLLIVAAVVAAGIERIDFLAGAGPFVLTPFIALAPLIMLVVAAHYAIRGADTKKPKYASFGGWVAFLLAIVLLSSLFFSETTRSVSRYVLLLVLICGGWALITLVRRSGNYGALRVGAGLGLALYVGFDLIQWATFQSFGLGPASGGVLNLQVSAYGEGVVRLGGGSIDPNRAAVTIATYTYILIGDPMVSRAKGVLMSSGVLFLGLALCLATISRSGLTVFGCVMIGGIAAIWRRQSGVQKLGTLSAAAAALIWVSQTSLIQTLNVVAIAESRLSITSEGSAESHFALFDEAWKVINDNPISILTGHGYGSSFLYLQGFFPGNEYANYHSMYSTMLVEGGILATALTLVLLVPAVFSGRRWLAVGALFFGVFYQGMSDPIFWIQVAMFWTLPVGDGRVQIKERTRPSPKLHQARISPAYGRMNDRHLAGRF